jgi:hypothetical protein
MMNVKIGINVSYHQDIPSLFHYVNYNNNSMALSPQANYTDWATATCRRNLVPTFADRGVSRGQRGGSPTVVNLSFLDCELHIAKISDL